MVKQDIKGIFPNIAKCGIEDIDQTYMPQKDDGDDGLFGNLGKTKTIKWKKYLENPNLPEYFDLDTCTYLLIFD